MTADKMPAAEVAITVQLVQALLRDQHPDLAQLAIVELANGWDNVMFRLGDDLIVRLPRRQMAADLVRHEQRWLPILASQLPLTIPAPVRVGTPTDDYPWFWSVLPWIPGRTAAATPPRDSVAAAVQLRRFLGTLHQPAPADAPVNAYRGGPLASRDEAVRQRALQLGANLDVDRVLRTWEECLAAPVHANAPTWLHGDLHPGNMLVEDGRLCAIIDFGDITSGDPACDLAVAWMLLPPEHREGVRYPGVDDAMWLRAKGWALSLSLAYLANSADSPMINRIGTVTLQAVLEP